MTDDGSRGRQSSAAPSRLATFIVRRPRAHRNQHPMDFAETFTDVLMATVMAKMVAEGGRTARLLNAVQDDTSA